MTRQVRGSTLLMFGRGIAIGVNLLVQVLTVRYLSRDDYGAFAFALAAVSLLSTLIGVGLHRAALRLVPIYHERDDREAILGTVVLMIGTVFTLGLAFAMLLFALKGLIGRTLVTNPLSLSLLLALILVAPIDAFHSLAESIFSIFSKPRMIFLRRHVAGPGLRLLAVVTAILVRGDVKLLAAAYVVGSCLGLGLASGLLWRLLREQRLFTGTPLRSLHMPVREVFSVSVPLFLSALVFESRSSIVVLFLEYFQSSTNVAEFRAVEPVARLNSVVFESFSLLFMPAAARLLARGQTTKANDLHWLIVTWIVVLSFPVFSLSFAFAQPLTTLLFSERYAESGLVLAVLSLGLFIHSALNVSSLTLKASGRMRVIVLLDAVAILLALILNLVLIPRFAALGAAIAMSATAVLHAGSYHAALSRRHGGTGLPGRFLLISVFVAACTGALAMVQYLWAPPFYVGVLLSLIAWIVILAVSHDMLRVNEIFPEAVGVLTAAAGRGGARRG